MLILQGLDNSILIENATGKITLTEAEAWDVLEYLHDTVGRDELYQARQHEEPAHPNTTEADYQAFRDEHAAQIRLIDREAARDEIVTWREVVAEEREQAAKHTSQEDEDTRKYMEHHYLGGE